MDESFRLWHHGGTYTFTVGFADGEPDRTRHVLERLFFSPDAHVSAVLVAVAAAARGSSVTRRGPLDEATKDELRWAVFSRWLAVTHEPAPRFAAGAGADARPAARREDDATADADAPPAPVDSGSRAPVTTWIELVLVDQHGLPVANRGYRVSDAGGTERSGTLGATGRVLLQGLTPGVAEVTCPADAPFAARDHVVQRGEHLAAIADRHGYDGVGVLWDHPDNAALRALRKDPSVLLEGDVVHLPERRSRSVPRATGAEHTFVVERTPLELRLLLESFTAKPIAGATLAPAPAPLRGMDATAGDGSVTWTIPAGTPRVAIQLLGEDTELSVGSLDPIDQDQGRAARLVNLGYLADDPEEPDDDALELAVELFQADAGLAITGLLDTAAASKLHALHGVLSGIRAMTEDPSIISAEHPVKHRLSLYVAPTTEKKSNRLRVPLVAVACWRMGDALFDFDSSFVLPTAKHTMACKLYDRHARLSPCEGWRGAPKQVSVFLDDATTGPVADKAVDLVFGDGTKDRKTTDGDGMLLLWARHGDHVDATYAIGKKTTTVRLFLRPPDASSEDGAWQRLANLGYVFEKPSPPPSPDRPDAMLGALQAFQAESDLPITDTLDAATVRALEDAHDRDRSAWRGRHGTGDPSPGPGDANVKASVT